MSERTDNSRQSFPSVRATAALCAMLAMAGSAVPARADYPADKNPPVYSYDMSPIPLAKRQAALAKLPLPAALQPIPRITCPLYVMEFHIWWRSPYGTDGRPGYGHWDVDDDSDTATRTGGPTWMRNSRHVGYPVNGLYNSEDEGILRWQLRCLHNAGVDGVFIQMYPEWDRGDTFIGTAIFAKILKIAKEEGVRVGIHDEIAFRRPNAQDPVVMAKRAGDFIKRFGDDPSFLRIDGKPVYAFQYWSRWDNHITDDKLVGMMKSVEAAYGKPVYWMPFHAPSDSLYRIPEIPSFVANGDSNMIARNVTSFYPPDNVFDPAKMNERLSGYAEALKAYPNKNLGMWVYPGFNDSPRPRPVLSFNWIARRGGLTLVERLRQYRERKPNFIMLSSWNDWEENTAIEPGLSYDGFDGDPYLYCRILAATKGKTFSPPPLPPKESVDPWLWQKLYGIDGEPPQVSFIPMPDSASSVNVTVSDADSGVRSLSSVGKGNASAVFTGATPAYTGINPPAGAALTPEGLTLVPGKSVNLPISPESVSGGKESDPAYIALTVADTAAGRIEVRFPSLHPIVQYKGNDYDEPKFPVHATFKTTGDGTRRAAVRRMLEWKHADPAPFVSLTWYPAKPGDKTPITLRRVDVFTRAADMKAMPVPGGAKKTWTFPVSRDTNTSGDAALFVRAEDAAGNISAPEPYLLP